jgi:hypothetical protein
MTKLLAALAAVSALAVGGAALAGAAGKQAPPANPPVAAVDSVQEGDQTAPDTGTANEQSPEPASEAAGESSSEIAANDGPGGHADEPGNASVDYQFQGEQ